MSSFELRDHTADIGVWARGDTLGNAFAAVGDGLAAAMCESWSLAGERFSVDLRAESDTALLFDYLDELIYLRDVEDVLPVDHHTAVRHVSTDQWELTGSFTGVPLASVSAREIKAVTYSEMSISERDDEYEIYVVFDV